MAERASRLVDHVLPDVPIRQWVLTLPHRIRYLLAVRDGRLHATSHNGRSGNLHLR